MCDNAQTKIKKLVKNANCQFSPRFAGVSDSAEDLLATLIQANNTPDYSHQGAWLG
jgi:hypothetical protein